MTVDFILMQGTVLCHNEKVTKLQHNTLDFIAADKWTSYSPDLNSLDYCIWDIVLDLVYEGRRHPFANLQNLKDAIKTNGRRSPLIQFENPLHN